ncbi:MAG TPA: 50S ribosomal protein L22 [bacterium]
MLGKAVAKYVRMTPRKVGYVIAPLRRRTVAEARKLLAVSGRRAAQPVGKLIDSAFANARAQQPMLQEDEVVISKLVADEGPTWKRFRAAAFGRAVPVLKRTSHITVELEKRA